MFWQKKKKKSILSRVSCDFRFSRKMALKIVESNATVNSRYLNCVYYVFKKVDPSLNMAPLGN